MTRTSLLEFLVTLRPGCIRCRAIWLSLSRTGLRRLRLQHVHEVLIPSSLGLVSARASTLGSATALRRSLALGGGDSVAASVP